MDFFSILSYINKISLIAFIITAGFLGYQFYLLKKETPRDPKSTPSIPEFNENEKMSSANYTKLETDLTSQAPVVANKSSKPALASVIAAGLLVLTLTVFMVIRSRQSENIPQSTQPMLTDRPVAKISSESTRKPTAEVSKDPVTIPTKPEITPTTPVEPTQELVEAATPSPTEVIIAVIKPTEISDSSASSNEVTDISPTKIVSLPITGLTDRALTLFGVAISFIFFAFIF